MLFRSVPAARFWSQDYKLVMESLVWQFTHQFGGEPVSVFEKKSATKVSSHYVGFWLGIHIIRLGYD